MYFIATAFPLFKEVSVGDMFVSVIDEHMSVTSWIVVTGVEREILPLTHDNTVGVVDGLRHRSRWGTTFDHSRKDWVPL